MTVILEIKLKFSDCKVKLCLQPRTQERSSQKISSSLNYCDPIQFDDRVCFSAFLLTKPVSKLTCLKSTSSVHSLLCSLLVHTMI